MSTIHYVFRKAMGLTRIVRDRLMLLPFGVATALVPRSPNLWVFGSWYGLRFADNPKYFFFHCHSLKYSPIRAVWLSKSPDVVRAVRSLGLPAYHRSSPRGLWYALRAGVYLLDCRLSDVHPMASRGALKVNLWHGVPLKKIERDIDQADHTINLALRGSWVQRAMLKVRRPELTERYDAVLATSDETATRFSGAFGLARERIIVAGYPRTDGLLATVPSRFLPAAERAMVREFQEHGRAGRRVLFYMPTFRDWGNTADRVIPIDWESLNRALCAHDGVFYCKLHPGDRAGLPDFSHLPRIRVLPSEIDPYPLLPHTHALISDYSSIFFDYLLLDRPIVFYPYDLEAYRQKSRSMYDDYEHVTPGPKAHDAADLERRIVALLSSYDEQASQYAAARGAVRRRFYAHVDDLASARLFEALRERTAA
jgi:CDP-glycerol glycerophosphotransferase (TagB/SpsB family)